MEGERNRELLEFLLPWGIGRKTPVLYDSLRDDPSMVGLLSSSEFVSLFGRAYVLVVRTWDSESERKREGRGFDIDKTVSLFRVVVDDIEQEFFLSFGRYGPVRDGTSRDSFDVLFTNGITSADDGLIRLFSEPRLRNKNRISFLILERLAVFPPTPAAERQSHFQNVWARVLVLEAPH